MALQLNINAELSYNSKSIELEDTTGAYNVTSNPTGYGTPNPDTTDVNPGGGGEITIVITDPDGNDYTFDFSTTPSTWPTFPNTLGTVLTIANTDVGLTTDDKITDGLWYVSYTILFNDQTEYTRTQIFLFHYAADCCINKLLAKIDGCCDECDEAKLKAATTAYMALQAAKRAARCAKPLQSQKLLDKVNFICNQQNCQCN